MFGTLKKVELVSQLELSASREAKIESCFETQVGFHYLSIVDGLINCCNTLKSVRERVVILPWLMITRMYLVKAKKRTDSLL